MKLMSKIKNEVEIKVNLFPASPKVAESGKDESPGFNGNENDVLNHLQLKTSLLFQTKNQKNLRYLKS